MEKRSKNTDVLVVWGIFNYLGPGPCLFLSVIWLFIVAVCFGFQEDTPASIALSLIPFAILPVSCIAAFAVALCRRKMCKMNAVLCMWTSLSGFLGFLFLLGFIAFLGSVG